MSSPSQLQKNSNYQVSEVNLTVNLCRIDFSRESVEIVAVHSVGCEGIDGNLGRCRRLRHLLTAAATGSPEPGFTRERCRNACESLGDSSILATRLKVVATVANLHMADDSQKSVDSRLDSQLKVSATASMI